jgi:gluconolactonase
MRSLMTVGLTIGMIVRAKVLVAQTAYPLTADSERHGGVPAGTLSQHSWTSQIFPGTVRDYWVYVPAQYRPETSAAVMVFQDGGAFVREEGRWRLPVVFDNLIHKGEMPVTIGIFINPGVLPAASPDQQPRYNRSFEYDALGDRYARFLLQEILPEVAKTYNLTSDPNLRAIGGSSSGGICAFTVAWNRPDAFRRVLSFIGSYTNLRGGNIYSSLIRKTEPKPIRVFLQDGSRDLNLYSGSWWIANQDMASALEYAGYDATFVTGDQAHNDVQGSAVLPDALRWLFRNWREPITRSRGAAAADRHFVTLILDPAHDWELVSEGNRASGGLAVDHDGNVYFTDVPTGRVHKIEHGTRKVTVFRDGVAANTIAIGGDGRLFAGDIERKGIVAYPPLGAPVVVTSDVEPGGLVVGAGGEIWVSEARSKSVAFVNAGGDKRIVREGFESPTGMALSPDHSRLAVADSGTRWVWSFLVTADGSLAQGEPFYFLETGDESSESGAAGMTVDTDGYLYVATDLGVQVCDQPGRVTAIISKPEPSPLRSIVFGGPSFDTLYVTSGDKVFRRMVRRRGLAPGQVVKPPPPQL